MRPGTLESPSKLYRHGL